MDAWMNELACTLFGSSCRNGELNCTWCSSIPATPPAVV